MTRNLASEVAPRGIRVNQVTPGGTKTPIWSSLAPTDNAMTALEARVARGALLGRMSEADEVAKAALYLASDDASNVTATEIVVDGGTTGAPMARRSIPRYRDDESHPRRVVHRIRRPEAGGGAETSAR